MPGLFRRCCLPLCTLLVVAGCGAPSYDGPRRHSLSGEVTFDGEPVDLGSISFLPQSEHERPSGGIITGGRYRVPEEKGANAGAYRVEIRWSRPTGKQSYDPAREEMVDEKKEVIPPRFNKQSELTVQVEEGQTHFDFHLESN